MNVNKYKKGKGVYIKKISKNYFFRFLETVAVLLGFRVRVVFIFARELVVVSSCSCYRRARILFG